MIGFPKQKTFVFTIGLVGFVLAGCEQPHRMAQPKPDTKIVCQRCYDVISTERHTPPRSDTPWDVEVSKHQCPDCKSEVNIYRKNGVLMVRCPRCAPEGLACDRCLPPDAPETPRQRVRRSLRGDRPDAPAQ